jgi:ABC-type nitrate/sulfonate/bicarbonate transport system substrate-binding protein
MRLSRAVLFGLLALGAGFAPARGAEPVKIRASWIVAPSDWTPLLPEKPDLLKHHGKSYVFEPVRYAGTPAVITAMANNEVELGNLAFSSLAIAIQNAGLDGLRVIGDQFRDGEGAGYSNQYFVLNDSPVRRVEDLKGKIVATNVAGSAVDIAMRAMLRKHGLEDKRDYTVVEAPFPTMKGMLTQKKADLASFVAPFSFDPELKQIARPLFSQKEAIGTTQMIVWVAREAFLEKNRAALVDFMEDAVRVVRWYLDPANHDEAVQIAAKLTKQPPERFAGWLFTNKEYSRSRDLIPNLAALQSNIEVQRELGFLKGPIDIQKYADLSLVQEGAARLK